ncbi:Asp-tRNA(Asn)/Glu-tRNA(Gln) amidotransferase subunit GatC [Helicobacter sp. MIT 00-7814]|uniref:Asp-tRNA(Asn)/Glu-tRNA(Gln) amidotransferase subunit GatC n=1 Tax=unclassified Helicobacter TaxID=2593540 RepID=UPI000E1F6340|nr:MULTISPECIES: Asp-tRNA(Asn)/Glu-tRNA(Gln) amidotransferase subunit GatC [unclassified Helicobacter]RDU57186.1 Asp-tRNA(Asn)/Glu-tRNA(Gln) amidotransferase subunit GatC [Helicobacter sp. MIT 00-7814]RDU57738.1 Asp-tRNA(Asn)/Glu-tRNA(Gln) amidotransferase subunit GatC [Helicobacter sp. MIT 99-10781]
MQIDSKLLEKLERLSMLDLSAEKKEQIAIELSEILGFVENLETLNIQMPEDSQNGFQKETLKTPMRKDVPIDSNIAKDVLAHAPQSEEGFFIVPKIIE